MKRIYLDYNATTPLDDDARAAMAALWGQEGEGAGAWANPSSVHAEGRRARDALERARGEVAAAVGAQASEVVLTASATEANHQALLGAAWAAPAARRRVVLSAIEHPCVQGAARRLARMGFEVVRVPVGRSGRAEAAQFAEVIDERTRLVSLLWAHNETGVVQPVHEVAGIARAAGALMHVDAAQALGRARLEFGSSGVDLLTVSGHKAHGPRGAGALIVRAGLALEPLLAGHQERGRRGGTEDVIAAVGFGVAARRAAAQASAGEEPSRQEALRDRLWSLLRTRAPELVLVGEGQPRLPNTLCVLCAGRSGEGMVMGLDLEGVAASSGAACTSGSTEPSPSLLAMGYERREAATAVRLSLGRGTSAPDIERAAEAFVKVWRELGDATERVAWADWAEEEDRWTQ